MTATMTALPETTSHLRRLKSGLIIPATTGTRTFVTQHDMLSKYFDKDFVRYGTDVPAVAATSTSSDLYEMTKNGNLRDILGSVHTYTGPLFWRSQDQVLTWVENYQQHLHPKGVATFFPFIVGEKRLVASVHLRHGVLMAYVSRFEVDFVWRAGFCCRVVIPQQEA